MQPVTRRRTALFTTDRRLVWALNPVLAKLGFSCDGHSDRDRFLHSLHRSRPDLVILDGTARDVAELVREMRALGHLETVIVALAEARSGEALRSAGADIVCDRRLEPKSVMDALRRAKALVTGDKRDYPRTHVNPITYLRYSFDGAQFCQAAIVDLSPGGVCIEALEGLQAGRTVHVSFSLPAMRTPIAAVGEIMWRDHAGHAGIRFTHIVESAVRQIERWLEAANRPFGSTLGLVPKRAAAGFGSW